MQINRGHDFDSQVISIPVDDQEPEIEERFDHPMSMGLSDHAAESFAFLTILAVLVVASPSSPCVSSPKGGFLEI
jgi:hypothetical protein